MTHYLHAMKSKFFILTILTFLCLMQGYAQRSNIYFLKNSGIKVSTRDSADFTRVVSEPDSGSLFYNVTEYYQNGKKKLISKSRNIDEMIFEGQCLRFYPSGKKQQFATYKAGVITGMVYDYFPNGRLYSGKVFLVNYRDTDYKFETCNDSTGKALTIDGNGYYIHYANDFKNIIEEGHVKDGAKEGSWKGRYADTNINVTFNETYKSGNLISGLSTDKDGKIYSYVNKEVEANYKGGIDAWMEYLTRKESYFNWDNENNKNNNAQGRVIIQFTIEKDGSLSNIKILRAPNETLANYVTKLLKLSPKWVPGRKYGIPRREVITLPLNFNSRY